MSDDFTYYLSSGLQPIAGDVYLESWKQAGTQAHSYHMPPEKKSQFCQETSNHQNSQTIILPKERNICPSNSNTDVVSLFKSCSLARTRESLR